jgi:hypothetical protein
MDKVNMMLPEAKLIKAQTHVLEISLRFSVPSLILVGDIHYPP